MSPATRAAQASDAFGDFERPSTWVRPPAWLRLPPTAPPPPPVDTRPSLLPVDRLIWEDFERLCLRLLELEAETVHVRAMGPEHSATAPVTRLYGTRGQAQFGIDVYSRDPLVLGQTTNSRRYVALQARRIKKVTKTALRNSVSDLLAAKWAKVARKFIYATSTSGVATQFTDEVETQAKRLARVAIELEIWDAEELSKRLRAYPEVVDDFFGRVWVNQFCGSDAATLLAHRLDGNRIAELRRGLARVYGASFGVADSGLLALRLTAQPVVGVHDRFVTPDLLATTAAAAAMTARPDDESPSVDSARSTAEVLSESLLGASGVGDADWSRATVRARQNRPRSAPHSSERLAADSWIGQSVRQVVVGEPGAGKSTLLRFLVLDLLSDSPSWTAVAERWGQRLPVWLPFHFFTQRVVGQTGTAASIGGALRAWLEQHDVGHLWPLVDDALTDDRLLLVVDGLDEWVDDEAGRYAATALETFASSHAAAVIVSTRPYGLAKLTLSGGWSYTASSPVVIHTTARARTPLFRHGSEHHR